METSPLDINRTEIFANTEVEREACRQFRGSGACHADAKLSRPRAAHHTAWMMGLCETMAYIESGDALATVVTVAAAGSRWGV